MDAAGLIAECSGRGRLLDLPDLVDFLRDRFGEEVRPDELADRPMQVEALMRWAARHGRGRPTLAAVVLEEAPS